jgi:hypothetical protein
MRTRRRIDAAPDTVPLPEAVRPRRDPPERLAAAVLGAELVAAVARMLEAYDIPTIPLKGVLLQHTVYSHPAQRVITDVDVLVPPERFDEACWRLAHAGFTHRSTSRGAFGVSFMAPTGMALDLHCHLFGRGRFRMSTAGVLARAHPDEELFGAPVWILDPYDWYAHLVGKFATDHADGRQRHRLEEIAALPGALGLDAERAALHLERCGLARAARYTLTLSSDLADDAFADKTLGELAPDVIGDLLARAARRIAEAAAPGSPLGSVPAHLLNHTLPAAAASIGVALTDGARLRLRRR